MIHKKILKCFRSNWKFLKNLFKKEASFCNFPNFFRYQKFSRIKNKLKSFSSFFSLSSLKEILKIPVYTMSRNKWKKQILWCLNIGFFPGKSKGKRDGIFIWFSRNFFFWWFWIFLKLEILQFQKFWQNSSKFSDPSPLPNRKSHPKMEIEKRRTFSIIFTGPHPLQSQSRIHFNFPGSFF